MKKIVILVAIVLLVLDIIPLYRNIQLFKTTKQELESQSNYVDELNMITQKNQEYYQTIVDVSNTFYTDDRLYLLWKNIEKKFGSAFVSVTVAPDYVEENNLKWFSMSVSVNMDPVSFLKIVKTITPPLFVNNLTYNKQSNLLVAFLKGVIISDNNVFVVTPDMEFGGKYVVCKYIMSTTRSDLAMYDSNYFVVKKDNLYYVGSVLQGSLDMLSAEGIANSYAQQGIITFVAQQGG